MAPPLGVRTGLVLGGFDVEGGYNRPGQPAHNWCWWEVEGRSPRRPPSGGFWQNWDASVAQAAAAGFDAVRVSVEWARCEPLDGEPDEAAVAGYCRMLDVCHEHGLQPSVTLHRFAHPAWMGVDFWLRPDSPERFCSWVEAAVEHFAGRTHQWVTIDQLNACALFSYLSGRNPPGRRLDVGATVRALDHLLTAHVLAYETIKERQPQAVVTTGNRHLPVYELDRLLVDVLLTRSRGVARHDVHGWLADRRSAYNAGLRAAGGGHVLGVLQALARPAIPNAQALVRAVAAVYDGPCERPLDVLQVSAQAGDVVRAVPMPGKWGRAASWGDRGGHVERACHANRDAGVPLSVSGDAPVGINSLRRDLAEVQAAVAAGLDVTAYVQRLRAPALERLARDERSVDRSSL